MNLTADTSHWFLFAHCDDEFAVFPVLEALARSGASVRCAYLTHGGRGAERRPHESLQVLEHFGVKPSQVQFLGRELGVPDGELDAHAGRILQRLIDERRAFAGPLNLWVPAFEGGHLDHDLAHLLGVLLLERFPDDRGFQVGLYNGRGLPGVWFRVMSVIPENGASETLRWGVLPGARWLRLPGLYRSQWRSWLGLFLFAAWRWVALRRLDVQRLTPRALSERPHGGWLSYERRYGVAFERFERIRDELARISRST